jgi:hypothetical protein
MRCVPRASWQTAAVALAPLLLPRRGVGVLQLQRTLLRLACLAPLPRRVGPSAVEEAAAALMQRWVTLSQLCHPLKLCYPAVHACLCWLCTWFLTPVLSCPAHHSRYCNVMNNTSLHHSSLQPSTPLLAAALIFM